MIASRSVSCRRSNTVERLGDRQVDVVGDRAPLHPDRQALRLQPLAVAGRARPQRAVRVELFLLGPAALVVAAAQVRQQPFEAFLRRAVPPNSSTSRALRGSLRERHGEIDAEVAATAPAALRAPACDRPCAHGAIAPSASDFALVRHDALRIEIDHRAEPLAVRAGAVRRVERERARRHLRHAQRRSRRRPAAARTAGRRRRTS